MFAIVKEAAKLCVSVFYSKYYIFFVALESDSTTTVKKALELLDPEASNNAANSLNTEILRRKPALVKQDNTELIKAVLESGISEFKSFR